MAVHRFPTHSRLHPADTSRRCDVPNEELDLLIGKVLVLVSPPIVAAVALVLSGALALPRLLG